jgi:adenylylsulfate kinase
MKNNKKGLVIWLTGLPCSGKTTIAKESEKYFRKNKWSVARLDGDMFRKKHEKNLGFTKKDRDENIRLAAEEAKKMAGKGVNVIAAFISPYQKMRSYAKRICPNFTEVYVRCSLDECMKRDSRGMYKKALRGEIKNFTGVQDPYEEPKNPDLVLDTENTGLKENIRKLINVLKKSENKKIDGNSTPIKKK